MESRNEIKFISLFLELHLADYKEDGLKALVPVKLLACLFIGAVIPGLLFYFDKIILPGDMLIIFSGLIAAQGIILAVTLSSVQSLLSNISTPGFSAFLQESGILKLYLYFVEYFQIVSIGTLLLLLAASFILAGTFHQYIYLTTVCLSSGMFFYSSINSISIGVLVKELIYYRGQFELQNKKDSDEGRDVVIELNGTQKK